MAFLKIPAACLLLLVASGCSSVSYLWQAGIGELALYNNERPLQEVISDPHTPQEVRERLLWIPEAKKFVERELGAKATSNYTTYVDLHRRYVVWALTSVPPYELKPKEWSFPIAGSVPYLGFFKESDALAWEAREREGGMDTSVRGVSAFSTLGYLRDPILSSMLYKRRADIVNLVFHETAHSLVYLRGESAFNEQAATFIGDYGERLWILKASGADSEELRAWESERAERRKISDLLREFAQALRADFSATRGQPEESRAASKARVFETFRQRFPARIAGGMKNNASLLEILTYEDERDVFDLLFERCGSDLRASLLVLEKLAGKYRAADGQTPQKLLRSWLSQASPLAGSPLINREWCLSQQ